MQIEVEFDIFKALTALRHSENDTLSDVIRRILSQWTDDDGPTRPASEPFGVHLENSDNLVRAAGLAALMDGGAWFGNIGFPDGTKFRATYKGRTYFAEIKDGQWIDEKGVPRTSPSDAASVISGTNVNGWRFWWVQLPDQIAWSRMDSFRK